MSNLPIFLSSPRENDIFISYAEEDIEFVKKLDAAIRKRNRDPWVDWDDLPLSLNSSTLDPWRYIEAGIKDADLFVFIISPASLKSESKGRELNLARHYNKRIVPVLWKEPEGSESLLSELPARNEWITIRVRTNFAIRQLVEEILNIDTYERLLKLAKKWDENPNSQDLLLYGQDLEAVQDWHNSSDQELEPLQEAYLSKSAEVERVRPKQPNVFISYSRKDKVFVEGLLGKLREQGQKYGLTFWIDWEKIPVSSPWLQRIHSGIERAHTFLLILSPCSAHSEYCRDEIVHAVIHGKRLVPIILAQNLIPTIPPEELDFDLERYRTLAERNYCEELFKQVDPPVIAKLSEKTKTAPESLGKMGPVQERNGHFFRQLNHFDERNVQKLLEDITDDDLNDADYHSELDKAAYRWLNNGQNEKDLLSEEKLAEAEQFRSRWQAGEFKRINLTYPQQEFIETSAKARSEKRKLEEAEQQLKETQQQLEAEREKRKNIRNILISVTAVVGTLLLSWGLIVGEQGRITEMVSSLDNVQELDALVKASRAGGRLQRWGLIFDRLYPDLRIRVVTALQQETHNLRERNRLEDTQQQRVFDISYSPDGQFVASASEGGVSVWTASGQKIRFDPTSAAVLNVVFAPEPDIINEGHTKYKRQIFAAAGEDGQVRLWQIISEFDSSGVLVKNSSPEISFVATLSSAASKENYIVDVAFSPSGGMFAAARRNGMVDLWVLQKISLEQWSSVQPISLNHDDEGGWVNSISFSLDGKKLVTAGNSGKIKLWGLNQITSATPKGGLEQPIELEHGDKVLSVSFSPNSKFLASSSEDGTIRLWTAEGMLIQSQGEHEGIVYQVIFSPDSLVLASAGQDNIVRLWDVGNEKLLPHTLPEHQGNALRGHQGDVYQVVFKDNRTLITASEDNTIKLWSWSDGKLLDSLEGHRGEVFGIDISPDGKELASASADRSIKRWDLENRIRVLPHDNRVNDVAFHSGGDIIATSGSRRIKLWHKNGSKLTELPTDDDNVLSVEFSPDGQLLASAGTNGKLHFWKFDHENNIFTKLFEPISNLSIPNLKVPIPVSSISFNPKDKRLVASAALNGTIRIWRLENEHLTLIKELQHGGRVSSISFSSDGELLASAGDEPGNGGSVQHTIRLWRISTDSAKIRADNESPWNADQRGLLSISFSSEKSRVMKLASAGIDGSVKLWTLQGKAKDLEDRGSKAHRSEVRSISFSPNGEFIASASEDGTIKLWTTQGNLITTLKQHRRGVNSVSFSPDNSSTLAAAGQDGNVYLWELPDFTRPDVLKNLLQKGCELTWDYIQSASQQDQDQEEVKQLKKICRNYPTE